MSLSQQSAPLRRPDPRYRCYTGGHSTATLSIELANGESLGFAWARFSRYHFDREKLVLTFADERIEIQGRNLPKLLGDIRQFHLETLRELPPDYGALADPGEPFVTRIVVQQSEQ
ncbi:MAG TPA: hypothetical protein VHC86_09710 [Opitutaceae bacterium]|nr:hypothetical protein [Opitutaceae bacterium]